MTFPEFAAARQLLSEERVGTRVREAQRQEASELAEARKRLRSG